MRGSPHPPAKLDLGPTLPQEFYARPADVVARELLGQYLAVSQGGEVRAGRIVECEAYLGEEDMACHASRGLTPRTRTLYGPPGTAYVYLIYGMYELFNAVCQPEGQPHAVLIRAVELIGTGAGARGDGPGRLTRALGITRGHNGLNLFEPPISLHKGNPVTDTGVSARIGVEYAQDWAEAPLRFYDASSRAVSRLKR